jgi:hypothetical protein
MVTSKVCSKCKVDKLAEEYEPRPERPCGIRSDCKKCRSKRVSIRYARRRAEEPVALWRQNAYARAKERAKKNYLDFDLLKSDVVKALEEYDHRCAYCGVALDFQSSMEDRWASASIDRVIPSLGYTANNIVVSCYRCNATKNNVSPEELVTLAEAVTRIARNRGIS